MKKNFVRIFSCLFAALLLAVPALAVVEPTDNFYVADYAGVLDVQTEAQILEQSAALDDQTGAQIVVVTVDFTGTESTADYAYSLFNDWGIGSASEDNGVLLLLVIGAQDYYLLQGRGLESVLTNAWLQETLDRDLEPYFAQENYDAGVRSTYQTILEKVSNSSGAVISGGSTATVPDSGYIPQPDHIIHYEEHDGAFVAAGLRIMLTVIFIVVIVLVLVLSRPGVHRSTGFYTHRPRYRVVHRPFFFHRPPNVFYRPPRPPHRPGGPAGFGGMNRPPNRNRPFGSSFNNGAGRRTTSGRSSFGGGVGRSSSGRSSFGGGAGRSSGPRSGGGGSSRGGGAGRRR